MAGISDGDKRMLDYFYFEKDLGSWANWEDLKPEFSKHYPELIDALDRLETAKKSADRIVRSIAEETE